MLHFAYGSNMSRALMRWHAPDARAVGPAQLPGYRFLIIRDGYASVMPSAGTTVHGVLWRLSPRDLSLLNAYESIASGLYRRAMLPVRLGAGQVRALVYIGRAVHRGVPRPGYLDAILEAGRDWALPETYMRTLKGWSPTRWRAARPNEVGEIA